jgi:hypothetical protein
MQAIAKAHENRSLADFEEALKVYKAGKLSTFWHTQIARHSTLISHITEFIRM